MLTYGCWRALFFHFITTKSKPSLTSALVRPIKPKYKYQYRTKAMMLSLGLLLIGILALSCLTSLIFKQNLVRAQQYIQTIKYRNLVIDLGNGVKTHAQLTYPAVGKGPFPGVLLVPWLWC